MEKPSTQCQFQLPVDVHLIVYIRITSQIRYPGYTSRIHALTDRNPMGIRTACGGCFQRSSGRIRINQYFEAWTLPYYFSRANQTDYTDNKIRLGHTLHILLVLITEFFYALLLSYLNIQPDQH
jgi:hypothetical protein